MITFASPEVATFWRYIASSLDRLVEVTSSIDHEGLHWRPPARQANSVAILVRHTLGNAEENLLGALAGQAIERDRDDEFATTELSSEELVERWRRLRSRSQTSLAALDTSALTQHRAHPRRGSVTGQEILIVAARHAAEHLGQAELSRDLWLATGRATGRATQGGT